MRRLVLALLLVALSASPASAETQRASGGNVSVELSSRQDEKTFAFTLALTVARAGQRFDVEIPKLAGCRQADCGPAGNPDHDAIRVRDLDADGEPEVLLDLYSGGAHCCVVLYVYRWTGAGYAPVAHDFADVGYRLAPGEHPLFVSGDIRFAYHWAAFAFTGFPVQLFEYDGADLVDVTAGHPDRIRADAARNWAMYRRMVREKYEVRGAIAAWAADRYRLGQRASTLRQLRRMARRGQLRGPAPRDPRAFVRQLDRELRSWGYRPAG